MERRPIVFVIQETLNNFTPAEQFGEVRFLSVNRRDDFVNMTNSDHNRRLLAHLRHGLRDYDEDLDWIVITSGSPYVTAAAFMILGRRGVQTLRLLRWDNRSHSYFPLVLAFK